MSADPVRILAVDDVPENLVALEALLRDPGIELLTARSGMEALELLLLHGVALALLDVQMPGMDGYELAELMRGTERTRRVPIIFLTGVGTDERRRFRGYEAGAVDYLLKPVDPQIVRSKVEIFVELYRQRQEIARQRDELAATLSRLTAHGDNSPLAIVELDPRQTIVAWYKGAERMFGWRSAEVAGFRPDQIKWIAPESEAGFSELMASLIDGRADRATRPLRFNAAEGFTLDCECSCSGLRDGQGRLVSINLQLLDVSERRRAEETQRLLVGELNHRVKNTLATVQAITRQTLRFSTGPSDFADTFLGRIRALASAHSLLSSATWKGANLRELIAGQAEIGALPLERFDARGPELELEPEPALHLALVLHELVTNAHKYGAFAQSAGSVSLDWYVVDGVLTLDWIERGGPPARAPDRTGFGTSLIERSLKADGGGAIASYGEEGMSWKLTLPYLGPAPAEAPPSVQAGPGDAPPPSAGSGTLAGRRVLVIEDEPLIMLELVALIEGAGGSVAGVASDHAAALALAEREVADCALLDGNLQGAAVTAIADALVARRVPFVFVSGYGREHLPEGHQAAPLITKPFDPRALMTALVGIAGTAPAA